MSNSSGRFGEHDDDDDIDLIAAGYSAAVVGRLKQRLLLAENNNNISSNVDVFGERPLHSVLLHGPRGCGKTAMVERLVQDASRVVWLGDVQSLGVSGLGFNKLGLEELGVEIVSSSSGGGSDDKVVVVIDDAADMFPPQRCCDDVDNFRLLEFLQFCTRMKKPDCAVKAIIVAIVREPERLHPLFRNEFRDEIEVSVPSSQQRMRIWKQLNKACAKGSLSIDALSTVNAKAHGYTGADIKSIVAGALRCAAARALAVLTDGEEEHSARAVRDEDVFQSFDAYQPRMLSAASASPWTLIPATSVDARWSDIGGLEDIKQALQEMVVWPAQHADSFERFGIAAPSGIVLHGPPGTGKTLLAKALAAEANANFLSVSIGSMIRGEVGESEKALAGLFQMARRCTPCILFFDEFQAMFGERGESGQVVSGIVSQMLLETDGLAASRSSDPNDRIILMATTNRIDVVDPALLRAGRFDRSVYVPVPDRNAREQILSLQQKRLAKIWNDSTDVTLAELSSISEGMTGAEIVSWCNQTGLAVVADLTSSSAGHAGEEEGVSLMKSDFEATLRGMRLQS